MIPEGFHPSAYRPWPADADFVTINIHPRFTDLCHRLPDGQIIYLTSKPKE